MNTIIWSLRESYKRKSICIIPVVRFCVFLIKSVSVIRLSQVKYSVCQIKSTQGEMELNYWVELLLASFFFWSVVLLWHLKSTHSKSNLPSNTVLSVCIRWESMPPNAALPEDQVPCLSLGGSGTFTPSLNGSHYKLSVDNPPFAPQRKKPHCDYVKYDWHCKLEKWHHCHQICKTYNKTDNWINTARPQAFIILNSRSLPQWTPSLTLKKKLYLPWITINLNLPKLASGFYTFAYRNSA
jgi:hypothetical protein